MKRREPRGAGRGTALRLSLAGRLFGVFVLLGAAVAAATAIAAARGVDGTTAALVGFAVGAFGAALGVPLALRRLHRGLGALESGVAGLRSRDYGFRLALEDDAEIGRLVAVFNELADLVGRERGDLRQRELLLHTVIETSPAAVLLVNAADRILLDNRVARGLFGGGSALTGRSFGELVADLEPALAEALAGSGDALVDIDGNGGRTESLHVGVRTFDLNARRHRLVLVRRFTTEIRRQEAAAWRKVTRVIAHELNNTLAPIRSMSSSARKLRERDPADPRIDEILVDVDASAAGLQRFVDGYRSLARLPEPRREEVEAGSFLRRVAATRGVAARVPRGDAALLLDPGQVQLALVNLLKNAEEAGGERGGVELVADLVDETLVVRILDRGEGLSEDALASALVPFYSTKKDGTGLGLALAREIVEAHGGHLSISNRPGGGVEVRCDFPGCVRTSLQRSRGAASESRRDGPGPVS